MNKYWFVATALVSLAIFGYWGGTQRWHGPGDTAAGIHIILIIPALSIALGWAFSPSPVRAIAFGTVLAAVPLLVSMATGFVGDLPAFVIPMALEGAFVSGISLLCFRLVARRKRRRAAEGGLQPETPEAEARSVLQPDAQEQNAPPLDVMVAVPVASEAKSGIGGWLILPAIGMVLGPPLSLVGIIRQLSFTFGPEYAESASEYAGLPVFNGFELVGKCALMILVCVATYWFFTKRTGAPKIIIGLMIYGMVFGAIRLIWGIALFGAENSEVVVAMLRSTNIIGQVISSAIWIPYFLTSERVRNTFTRR